MDRLKKLIKQRECVYALALAIFDRLLPISLYHKADRSNLYKHFSTVIWDNKVFWKYEESTNTIFYQKYTKRIFDNNPKEKIIESSFIPLCMASHNGLITSVEYMDALYHMQTPVGYSPDSSTAESAFKLVSGIQSNTDKLYDGVEKNNYTKNIHNYFPTDPLSRRLNHIIGNKTSSWFFLGDNHLVTLTQKMEIPAGETCSIIIRFADIIFVYSLLHRLFSATLLPEPHFIFPLAINALIEFYLSLVRADKFIIGNYCMSSVIHSLKILIEEHINS